MCRTFNCGIGMVLAVDAKQVDDVCQQLIALGETPFVIGEVAAKTAKDRAAVEIDCRASLS
jgi:phosphoribosylformylglycinamidine cyclo-ligase